MIRNIITAAARVALGIQNCLYINDLSVVVEREGNDQFPNSEVELTITVREFVRKAFTELGIEIEFSGKNEHEKGVIIDVDEDRIMALQLNAEALKFGQTIVRIGDEGFRPTTKNNIFKPIEKVEIASGLNWDELIVETVKLAKL